MARSGSFGGGLNPFGTGSSGGLGKYDIGPTGLALLQAAAYKAEVGWANGVVPDDEYLGALQKLADATHKNAPDSQDDISAQNRIFDAKYQIGRSKAIDAGLDALVAFDEHTIAGMNPNTDRYRSVTDSLNSEHAQQRSRDYGVLVDKMNVGQATTESVLAWVKNTLAHLPPGAVDLASWQGAQKQLNDRIVSEKDAEVYQQYQHQKIKPEAFLAYITSRRDSYAPNTSQFEDWSRKLEDAQKQVKDTADSAADQKVFNAYSAGHLSDKKYLAYISNRIKHMDPTDPNLPQWQQRLRTDAFSIAEQELRFAVSQGKKPIGTLIGFYTAYRKTLTPNSPEYRRITTELTSLGHRGAGGGGGGGGGSKTAGSKTVAAITGALGKAGNLVIDPKGVITGSKDDPLSAVLPLLTVNPAAKGQKAAYSFFVLNESSLSKAVGNGADHWMFFDPRHPGQTTQAMEQDASGNFTKVWETDSTGKQVLDKNGKPIPVMVEGSGYLPTAGNSLATLDRLRQNYYQGLAQIALANHDAKGYAVATGHALVASDDASRDTGTYITRNDGPLFDNAAQAVDLAMKTGDYATAANIISNASARIKADLAIPGLDPKMYDKLNAIGEKLGTNPLLPTKDAFGNVDNIGAIDPLRSTKDANGNWTSVVLNDGWHHVLDSVDKSGTQTWQLVHDNGAPGTWDFNADGSPAHITVQTNYGGSLVTGEVSTHPNAPINTLVDLGSNGQFVIRNVNQPSASGTGPGKNTPLTKGVVNIHYPDEHGRQVNAYSVDGGSTWVKSETGTAPMLQLNVPGLRTVSNADGSSVVLDGNGDPVAQLAAGGAAWTLDAAFVTQHPDAVQWFNQGEAQRRMAAAPAQTAADQLELAGYKALGANITPALAQEMRAIQSSGGDPTNLRGTSNPLAFSEQQFGQALDVSKVYGIGAPGQHMTIVTMGPDGLNLLPGIPAYAPGRSGGDERPATAIDYQVQGPIRTGGDERPGTVLPTLTSPSGAAAVAQAWSQLPSSTPPRVTGTGYYHAPPAPTLGPPASTPGLPPLPTVSPINLQDERPGRTVSILPPVIKSTPAQLKATSKAYQSMGSSSLGASATPKAPKPAPLPPAPRVVTGPSVAQ